MIKTYKIFKILLILLVAYLLLAVIFSRSDTFTFNFEKTGLKDEIADLLKDSEGKYGIYIKNLSTGEIFSRQEDEEFQAGSLYKLWVMKAAFEQIKEGKIKEDDLLVADVVFLNKKFDLDKEEAEFQSGMINFSIKSAIEQMITISHNYAALALLNRLGSSEDIPEKITAKEAASFLEKLYRGEIIDQEYSKQMMELLSRQTINDRIPKYLPPGTKVAHKTGDIGFFENDAGVIFSPKGDFVIVVLSETKDPAAAGEIIAKISEAVYDYFN
ncbi:serine hydrolase [Candidatus Daviesbacteria bacterium]|nr:serine hydrolase [Candidatus Daviesbacteria bacterium]